MRFTSLVSATLGAALLLLGMAASHAADGLFYDPRNAASPTGYTIGHELFRTIGCPGRQLLDTPCPVLDSARPSARTTSRRSTAAPPR